MQATKQWFNTLFAIPVAEMNGAPTSLLMEMRHALGLLYALSTIDEPGWQKADMAPMLDFYPTLDRLADFLSQIPVTTEANENDEGWWLHVATTVRTLRSIWAGQDEAGINNAAPVLNSFNANEGGGVDGTEFDFPGLDWLMDPAMMASTF